MSKDVVTRASPSHATIHESMVITDKVSHRLIKPIQPITQQSPYGEVYASMASHDPDLEPKPFNTAQTFVWGVRKVCSLGTVYRTRTPLSTSNLAI